MKPILLRMEAFGPYSSPTTVDFSRMGSGLFLITGNTGSGKTMIFDAMTMTLGCLDSDAEYFRGEPEYLMVSLDSVWGMWRWPRAT